MNKIKSAIGEAVKTARGVAAGVKDYAKENKAVHNEALATVSAEQKKRISTLQSSAGNEGATPMGGNQVYDAASELADRLKNERGISLGNSIRRNTR